MDVTDDYTSEKDQIKKIKGKKYRFSFGDYVVKSMVSIYSFFLSPCRKNLDKLAFKLYFKVGSIDAKLGKHIIIMFAVIFWECKKNKDFKVNIILKFVLLH